MNDDFLRDLNDVMIKYGYRFATPPTVTDGHTVGTIVHKIKNEYDYTRESGLELVPPDNAYELVMSDPGQKKIHIIKLVRQYTHIGLKEAKDFVDAASHSRIPVSMGVMLPLHVAQEAEREFQAAGADVYILRATVSPEEVAAATTSLRGIVESLDKENNG